MLIFLHSGLHTHVWARLAVTGDPKKSWIWLVNVFIFKNSDFSALGYFSSLAPLARFVWVCACVNFAPLRTYLPRFFSNIFYNASIFCFRLFSCFVTGFFEWLIIKWVLQFFCLFHFCILYRVGAYILRNILCVYLRAFLHFAFIWLFACLPYFPNVFLVCLIVFFW